MHSIEPPAATWWATSFDDGVPIAVANPFYATEADWFCHGARYYFAPGAAEAGQPVTLFAMEDVTATGIPDPASTLRSGAAPAGDAGGGWVEVLWDPVPIAVNEVLWIGCYAPGGRYVAHNYSASRPLQATDGSGLFMGVYNNVDGGLRSGVFEYSPATPPWITSPGDSNFAWGVDILAGPLVASGVFDHTGTERPVYVLRDGVLVPSALA